MKVSIIGSGMVGSSIAFALLGSVHSIEMVDINTKRAMAECFDLEDASKVSHRKTYLSWSAEPSYADVYIICAGHRRKLDDNSHYGCYAQKEE